ncbi:MAG: TIGR02584 family CRISPR-associated protein [Desulfoarculaceae bacterium]|nr:TIGR02584 family CRISPR-associated protein [Desulfoarculaceae bacterium]
MRNILLAVSGLSPQVITEALYALWHEGRAIHAVHVITTRSGKERILASLLAPEDGKFQALLADCGIEAATIDFGSHNIHVLRDAGGRELADIVTPDDNEVLARTCLELAFRFTAGPETAVFFLVAGGRKTMTSCLTLAAQLYGRPQDRILHVLVSPEFESCREFWFPPRKSVSVQLRDDQGQPYWKETRYAVLHLITIPFISVRDHLRHEMLDQPRPPADLMQALIRDTPQILVVNLAEGKLIYGKLELDMHPTRLALYAFFAERKKKCHLARPCTRCDDCFLEATEVLSSDGVFRMYERIPGGRLIDEMSDSGICSLTRENFQSYKSKIRRDLLAAFGQGHLAELEITSCGTRPGTRYGIRLDRSRIRMEW